MAPSVSPDAVGVRASDDEASVKKRKKKSKDKDKDKERRKRKERDPEDGQDGGDEPTSKKRSKKRARDADDADENDGEPDAVVEPVVDGQPRKKRRKKKKHTEPDAGADDDDDAQIDPVLRRLAPAPAQQSHDPNAEILQILQSVDISKIDVDALFKNVPSGSVPHFPLPAPLPTHNQPVSQPDAPASKPKPKAKAKATRSRPKSSATVRATPPPPGAAPTTALDGALQHENTPEHVALLTTKWLSSKKLEQMIKDEGLLVKKGKFSVMEERALRDAVEKYRFDHNLSQDELQELIFTKFKRDGNTSDFWTSLALQVPQRTLVAIYHWVKRAYNPLSKQGKWTEEEDAALLEAMGEIGQAWEKLSERVGRTASDCRDRWRNHLVHRESRNVGPWSEEEEEELTRIVIAMTLDKGKSADSDVFWTEVARRMENKRSRQQCRVKWTDGLNKRVKNDGQTPRWTPEDGVKLITRVEALNVRHDSEINWNSLNDASWNLWSAHQLQRRWLTMKRSVNGHEQMPLREILDDLKTRKGLLTTTATSE